MNLLIAAALLVQQQPSAEEMRKYRTEQALERARTWLLAWTKNAPTTITADVSRYHELVLYTLMHLGVDPTDKTVQLLATTVSESPLDRTYNVALCAMALEALDRTKYRSRIAQCAQFLVDQQAVNGQWGYGKLIEKQPDLTPKKGDPKKPGQTEVVIDIKRQGKGPATGDNSNSQYAALGLRACMAAGIGIPRDTLQLALDWWERAQRGEGSWAYDSKENNHLPDSNGYASMTSGAVGSLVILRSLMRLPWDKDEKIKKGVEWLGTNFNVKENAKYRNPLLFNFYGLYALERVGSLMAIDKVGAHEWYPAGADHLLAIQLKEGSWDSKSEMVCADTCFAVLFLRKATRPAPKIASGSK
jgi:hypothetical protein